jgi:hypothetical protein
MNPSNWWRLDDRPVFWSSDVAFATGHASFPFDRDGTPWIVYHAKESKFLPLSRRETRSLTRKL